MEEENLRLKQLVEDLKSELTAAMRREELLTNPMGGAVTLKQKLRVTKLGRMATDPNSKLGKVVRLPRTIYRIVRNPSILKEMRKEGKKCQKMVNVESSDQKNVDEMPLFVPIKFFLSSEEKKRLNVVTEKIDEDLMGLVVPMANKNNLELRVVTYGAPAEPNIYSKMVKEKKIPAAKKISFYSSYDQSVKNKIFELEVGKNDIFITRAWGDGSK